MLRNARSRRRLVISLAVLAVMLAVSWWRIRSWVPGPLRFDAEVWRRDNLEALNSGRITSRAATRDRMVKDLLRRYPLKGMTRSAVVALLGEPDASRQAPFEEWDMLYWLGPDVRGLDLDYSWLVLKLDSAGVVSEWKVLCD